ncbi:MAG TPA: metalloregulator ArsR/SmtB family transcription factor [Sandaracinaceae bacterium LLY-WYZ-13_1]|nr:metalloregulator ArsR/SmtB family transcription factor [Sandaracinaceae bacterium LLY-WYZ-13_1]
MGPVEAVAHAPSARRWELYRLLSEPFRLRLLALCSAEELAIGELTELLGESQPNVSRHAKALREAGLLTMRKQGRWAFLRLTDGVASDPVVGDALDAGRALCEEDGSLGRVAAVVEARDAAAREFFARPGDVDGAPRLPVELPAYLSALAPLIAPRRLAVDAGTGDGSLLDVLAPIFERVVAFDRAEPQLERARRRVAARGYDHVELSAGELGDPALRERVAALGGADAVFASRVLHHAPKPADALAALAAFARSGGVVAVIDYASHQDERLREQQADLWLGFGEDELRALAERAGLVDPVVRRIPSARCGDGPDGHLDWQVLVARTR